MLVVGGTAAVGGCAPVGACAGCGANQSDFLESLLLTSPVCPGGVAGAACAGGVAGVLLMLVVVTQLEGWQVTVMNSLRGNFAPD